MTMNTDDFLNSILANLSRVDYIKSIDIPNIDLYMDQVTTFMNAQLSHCKRYDEDKILTKTMINNYAKNNLLPPPLKKKYSKEHVLVLTFIYYFKNFLSIKDIETLLKPLTDRYFKNSESLDLTAIYEEICQLEKSRIGAVQENIKETYMAAISSFTEAPEEEREFLQLFSFICTLSFDVYLKKQLIEKLIDELPKPEK